MIYFPLPSLRPYRRVTLSPCCSRAAPTKPLSPLNESIFKTGKREKVSREIKRELFRVQILSLPRSIDLKQDYIAFVAAAPRVGRRKNYCCHREV